MAGAHVAGDRGSGRCVATSNEEDDEIGGGSMVKVGRTNRWTLPAVVALGIVTAVATALSATAQEPDDRLAIDFHATRLDGTLFNGATLEG